MFDIGFSELFVIAIVALLVLGPERLPKAARFAGLWVRRARAQWYSVKSELETQLADEDLKRSLRQTEADLREARDSLVKGGAALQQDLEQARTDLQDSLRQAEIEEEEPARLGSSLEELEEPPPPVEDDDEAVGHEATGPAPTPPAEDAPLEREDHARR